MRRALAIIVLAGCPKPPPPPSVTEPPRLVAEESCTAPTAMPVLPARLLADPYRLSHPAEMSMLVGGAQVPVSFLCDLPDQILGLEVTQTVDSGRRIVSGAIHAVPRVASARALPPVIDIAPSSPGCRQGELACELRTASPAITKIEMLREQWIHTSGWVHGMDDICRALPDDTIAVCSTKTRMAYVELGCDGELHLGLHDASLARTFDLDVEAPNARMRGALEPASRDAAVWTFRFAGDARSTASPATKPPASATLEMRVTPPGVQTDKGGAGHGATLTVDGASEPCIAWAIYRT
ncbi:MAG: hypothetical protein AB7T06_37545 [Kofleriaceae bacterium]